RAEKRSFVARSLPDGYALVVLLSRRGLPPSSRARPRAGRALSLQAGRAPPPAPQPPLEPPAGEDTPPPRHKPPRPPPGASGGRARDHRQYRGPFARTRVPRAAALGNRAHAHSRASRPLVHRRAGSLPELSTLARRKAPPGPLLVTPSERASTMRLPSVFRRNS